MPGYYRFKNGVFVRADSYAEAQAKLIMTIRNEQEDVTQWYKCTCLGFGHREGCPEKINEPIAF